VQYGGKLTLYTFLSNQLQGVDVLLVGALFASTAVADYAIAARIAVFYPFFQQLLLRQFTPRAGYLLERQDLPSLKRELTVCRDLSIATVGITACALLLAGPFVLPLFGDYEGAASLMGWLALPAFVRAFFLGGDRLIQAAGRAGISLAIMSGSFALVVLTPFAAWPWLGVVAVPVGMILSAVILNSVTAMISWRLWQIRLIGRDDVPPLVIGCAVFLMYALGAPGDLEWLRVVSLVGFAAWLIRKHTRMGAGVYA
jgi:O-antigen/teichoic acid export membrane protein